jgi:hypothetical protein
MPLKDIISGDKDVESWSKDRCGAQTRGWLIEILIREDTKFLSTLNCESLVEVFLYVVSCPYRTLIVVPA